MMPKMISFYRPGVILVIIRKERPETERIMKTIILKYLLAI